jgi:hypothetical protein
MDKKHCVGCYNDFYNYGGVNGNTKQCWMLKDAKLIKRKEVHIEQMPPYNQKAEFFPNCYRKQRFAYINEN